MDETNNQVGLPGKNIIVLCDGTANQVNVYAYTNIVRMAERLDKSSEKGPRQVVFYDPGLGTENAPGALTVVGRSITKLLGLAFGYGLGKNLSDAYAFLMQHYEPGDRIYIFGFSRGAYTARALAGLLGRVGLLEKGCNSLIPYIIKYYRASNTHQLNFFKKRFSRTYLLKWGELMDVPKPWDKDTKKFLKASSKGVIPVHFLGVWDTVSSIGLLRSKGGLPDTNWLANMVNGRHAVAIHEKRSQYQPELWKADTEDETQHNIEKEERRKKGIYQTCLHQDVITRWFRGVHADVGGGYGLSGKLQQEKKKARKELKSIKNALEKTIDQAEKNRLEARAKELNAFVRELQSETALAYFSLKWMTDAAKVYGLRINMDEDALEEEKEFLSIVAEPQTPLTPFWWVLGWKKRIPGKIFEGFK